MNLYLKQTVSEKFIEQKLFNLQDTLSKLSFHTWTYIFILFRHYIYSKKTNSKQISQYSISCDNKNIHPYYVTGFSDAESSFIISIYKNNKKKSKRGWRVQPAFAIHLHIKDIDLLKSIQSFFGIGVLVTDKTKNSVIYSVNNLEDIIYIIIPHFYNYPLLTKKYADFLLFKSAVFLLKDKKHLTLDGLNEIVNIRASMNKGLTETLTNNFS